ncbi:MAG: hypothetical protein PF590_06560 [Candidatus Delongbacteria bacterium]|jgi:hypothetical protein|nr:hypothetical protein [Candidatus Delongbacteria bacterium]
MKKCIILLALVTLTFSLIYLSSCNREDSIDVNQDRIYTLYEMNYDANAEKTIAKATFRMGGAYDSKIKLSDGSSVEFNGSELSFNGIYAYYTSEFAEWIDSGEFVFEDMDGNEYTNPVEMLYAEFPEELDTIVQGEPFQFYWDGDPLTVNEEIILTVDGPLDKDTKSFYVSEEGAEYIELSSTETATLSKGASILALERKYETESVDAPSVGGKIISEYKAASYATYVVE